MGFFADKFADGFRTKGTAKTALQQFKRFHPWIEVNFTADDWGILMQSLKQLHSDAAADLEPSHRIKIVGSGGEGHDLTEPLVWLMSVNE